jgi:glutamine amidotransferase
MNKKIGILDYGMGNINSVYNALVHVGYDAEIVNQPEAIQGCSHLIIPGVGSYANAMSKLISQGLDLAILAHAASGKPLLGICLGMQILSQKGDEGEITAGLGLIDGCVELLDIAPLSVPHVGWNSLTFNAEHPLFNRVKKHVDFYFVHSYFFNAAHEKNVLAYTDYGTSFPAIVVNKNVIGIQFHPEKSQDNGLLLIENFCEWDGAC